jgi:hypothetical protein
MTTKGQTLSVRCGRMVGRGRVLHEGRWVTKVWYRRHVIEGQAKPQRKKRERDLFAPDHIEWVRSIMEVIDTITNPAFRATVCAMLAELHRLKSTPPNK